VRGSGSWNIAVIKKHAAKVKTKISTNRACEGKDESFANKSV